MSSGSVKQFRQKKKNITRDIAETMILSKLYRDGIFKIDEAKKTATVDARKDHLIEMYQEESYDDIISIINRTAKGLTTNGYTVTVKRIDIIRG